MKKIEVDKNIIQDAINIASGAYAPLGGFLGERDYRAVLDGMRLAEGAVWSWPIVVPIGKIQDTPLRSSSYAGQARYKIQDKVVLYNNNTEVWLEDVEVYGFDKQEFAEKVYGTTSLGHPGVRELKDWGEYLLGGKVKEIIGPATLYPEYNKTPLEMKEIFNGKNWQTVAGFQTRNVPHQGHVFLQKEALKQVDGLLIQPVVGEKKLRDFKDEYIISSYQLLIDNGHYQDRAVLGVLPLKMRYAGPREAVLHALIRRNYGCTHFIVGRDHAGVGDFYAPDAAQKIFNNFTAKELGIEILKFKEAAYHKKNKSYCFIDEVNKNATIKFSGTKLREYVEKKLDPPESLIHPEVFRFLINSQDPLVDTMAENNQQAGYVLWLTGLSAAGKTTIADRLYLELNNNGSRLERLDGDIVRERLAKGLGFDKAGRNENIRRIGFVADLLSRNGVGVLASFITPYREQREALRKGVHNYIEVFVDAPLAVCEQRDPKGMYKKARAGEIKLFTGIDDPYEAPQNPDIHLLTNEITIDEAVDKIINYLRKNNFIK